VQSVELGYQPVELRVDLGKLLLASRKSVGPLS
jgi:hypothetical protein